MNTTVKIKAVGERYGTVGWLRESINSGKLVFEESNSYYIPPWSNDDVPPKTQTHGLIIRDAKNENNALLAYRNMSGSYKYNVNRALDESQFAHWPLPLTSAAIEALESICEAWIEAQDEDKDTDKITVTIQRT
jgi:hypothetical protein